MPPMMRSSCHASTESAQQQLLSVLPCRPGSRAHQQGLFALLQKLLTSLNNDHHLWRRQGRRHVALSTPRTVHAQIIVNGYFQKQFLLSKLFLLFIACMTNDDKDNDLDYLYLAFKQIDRPSTVLCNHIIRAFSTSPNLHMPLLIFTQHMMQGNPTTLAAPDAHTYSFLLASCRDPSLSRQGLQLHARVVSAGFYSSVFVCTNLINMYCASGAVFPAACRVFDEMPLPNVSLIAWNSILVGLLRCGYMEAAVALFDEMPERNVVSWTTMISGSVQAGRYQRAIALFHDMQRAHVHVDHIVLLALLSACAEVGDVHLGRWIHACHVLNNNAGGSSTLMRQQHRLNNALMHMYAKCGFLDDAQRIFQEMPWRSTVSWNTLITGFSMHGRGEEALAVFKQMQSTPGVEPDEVTFIGVLSACSHAGLVDEGARCFDIMTQVCSIELRIEHYGCMVDLLSRAGMVEQAYELIASMPLEPNSAIWCALLSGCRIHKREEMASHLPELDPDHLVLLANVYAAAKRWDDVLRVWERKAKLGLRKLAGRSSVQVKGVLHEFMAGDESHPQAAAILDMIYLITRQTLTHEALEEWG